MDPDQPAYRRGRTIHGRIRAVLGDLTPGERRLADVILNFPGDLAGYSASELAGMADVSNAAVSRFVRRLDFQAYDEMRRQAREEKEAGSSVYLVDPQARDRPAPIRMHVETVIGNLQASFHDEATKTIEAVATAVAGAPQVWIGGFRHGRPLADYLRWSLAHARAGVRVVPSIGETLGEAMVDIGPDDVVVLFALRRRVPAVMDIVSTCFAKGTRIAIVTDPTMAEPHGATWMLRCHSGARGHFDDHASAFVFCHVLTEQVWSRLGQSSLDRLSSIEDLHRDMKDF